MAGQLLIRPFDRADREAVIALILSIQREEFAIPITAEDQPDLADVPGVYQTAAGGFWVAESADGAVVGTIALKDIGNGEAALRKMFVHPDHRGASGVAAALLAGLLQAARTAGLSHIYLGTTDKFLAAHRFYEKNGFHLVDPADLPPAFPRMAIDTRFYELAL